MDQNRRTRSIGTQAQASFTDVITFHTDDPLGHLEFIDVSVSGGVDGNASGGFSLFVRPVDAVYYSIYGCAYLHDLTCGDATGGKGSLTEWEDSPGKYSVGCLSEMIWILFWARPL